MKMLEEMNIFVEWQVPNSPETNLLDLGIWMAIQSYAEMLHKNKVMQADVLADSVEKAWDVLSSSVLTKVHERWKLVLNLILAGKGSNDLVEKHRGIKAKLDDMPSVPESDGNEYLSLSDDDI